MLLNKSTHCRALSLKRRKSPLLRKGSELENPEALQEVRVRIFLGDI
jgi:hypothetical protein